MIPALLLSAVLAGGFSSFTGTGHRGGASGGVAPLPLTYVCYGDSLFENGQGGSPCSQMAAAIPGAVFVNNAIAGYTAQNIRDCYFGEGDIADSRCDGYQGMVTGSDAARVVLNGGVNTLKSGDAVTGQIEAQALEPIQEVVEHALGQGHDVTWFLVTPYAGCAPPLCPEGSVTDAHIRATTFNSLATAACATLSAQYPRRLHCIDPYSAFEDPENQGFLKPEFDGDGIHWTAAGAERAGCFLIEAQGYTCPD
jgi:hypothetical protein